MQFYRNLFFYVQTNFQEERRRMNHLKQEEKAFVIAWWSEEGVPHKDMDAPRQEDQQLRRSQEHHP